MEKSKLILNGIFYIIITIIFIILFVKEKQIGAFIKTNRDKFSDNLVLKLGWEGKSSGIFLKKAIAFIESIGTALILVLIIQKIYLGNFLVPTGSMEPTIMPKDRLFGNMVVYKFRKPERNEIIVFKEPIQNKVLYTKRAMGLPGEKVFLKDNHLYVNDEKINIREYSSLGQLGEANYWIIPKKGDTIEVIPGANYGEYTWSKGGKPVDVAEVQKQLVDNPGAVAQILPDLEFRVNGEKTGMVLDIIHDSKAVEKILSGEKVTVTADEDYYLALGDNTNGSYDSRMWGFVKESRIKGKAFVRFWPLNRISLLK